MFDTFETNKPIVLTHMTLFPIIQKSWYNIKNHENC